MYYGKAVEYLINDCHTKNYDTTISTLAKIFIKSFQYYRYFVNSIFSESLLSDTQQLLHSNDGKNIYSLRDTSLEKCQ